MKPITYPRAEDLVGTGIYRAESAEASELPRHLLEAVAIASPRVHQVGPYKRWCQIPVAANAALRVQLKDEEFFAPHRAYAASQLTRQERNGKKEKSATISTLELPSRGFHDVRPADSMWRRIGVNHWPQIFFAWVEDASLYVRKFFNGDELRALSPSSWEFFENHPAARVFKPVDVVQVTLFYDDVLSSAMTQKFVALRMKYAGRVQFRIVDVAKEEIDAERYCVEDLPCLYAEILGTSRLKRLVGRRMSPASMDAIISSFLS